MKKIIASILVLTVLSVFGCAFTSSPPNVVKKFYASLEKGEVNEAYKFISKDGQKLLEGFGMGANALMNASREITNNGGIKKIDIIKEETKGEMSVVSFNIIFGNGKTKNDTEKLIKEDGKWRIAVTK